MFKVAKLRRGAIPYGRNLGVTLTVFLILEVAAFSAEPVRGKGYRVTVAALNPGTPPATGSPAPANRFEISLYTVKAGDSENKSDEYTVDLVNALEQRNGWVSVVHQSHKSFDDTDEECERNKGSCDVVWVTEHYDPTGMIFKLIVNSFPESHRKIHANNGTVREYPCNPSHCSREVCRALFFKDIVERLAGMDKDHKSGRPLP